jgi:Raf kinase inhibitor-like YbhB/YbcL family protein
MRSRILSSVLAVAMATTLGAALGEQGAPPAGGAAQGGGGGRGGGGRGGGLNLAPLLVESDAFPDGGIVPMKYAGRGGNTQPGFKLSGAPATAVSYAIIFHDIDVALNNGTDDVLHWIAWNIPVSAGGIPEGKLPEGSVTGNNITQKPVYFGPGAPPGVRYHHYVFEFYALNANLDIPQTSTRADLLKAMEGKVVAKAAYVGRFRGEAAPAK